MLLKMISDTFTIVVAALKVKGDNRLLLNIN